MNIIAHVEIPVARLERAIHFYGMVFGIRLGEVVAIHDNQMAYFPLRRARTVPAARWPWAMQTA